MESLIFKHHCQVSHKLANVRLERTFVAQFKPARHYGNRWALKSTEKYADSTQWVENGLGIFLGILDQYSQMTRYQEA
jgi:hypothetical protein